MSGSRKRNAAHRGVFVTFEGIEGSGKSTQLVALAEFLREKGLKVHVTREPGGTPIGDSIREILLRADHSDMTPLTEILLYGACRSQHVHQVIGPALKRGITVLCDRFSDATVAYQGSGRGLDPRLVERINAWATDGLCPDLTILLDCTVEVGLERSRARLQGMGKLVEEGRFEMEQHAFHQRVREAYLKIAENSPGRFAVVDAHGPPEEVQVEIRNRVLDYLNR